jgi:hypothetical protein
MDVGERPEYRVRVNSAWLRSQRGVTGSMQDGEARRTGTYSSRRR